MKLKVLFKLTIFLISVFIPFSAKAIVVEITASVPGCGDNLISVGEQCDGSNLGGSSCTSLGFGGGGTLSCSNSCSFNTSSCVVGNPNSGGGGGGGGGGSSQQIVPYTNVVFIGKAYPRSTVTLLKDAQVAATTVAGADANFQITISGVSSGSYIFSMYSEDSKGARSSLLTFPVSITSGVTTKVSGIFIAPTIATDKSEVKRGDNIVIFGQTTPMSEVTININSEPELFLKRNADSTGAYLLNLDSSILEMGQHTTRSKSALDGEISAYGASVGFTVGTKNVVNQTIKKTLSKADLNGDGKINLVDFSIMAYWYKRSKPPVNIDMNNDGKIDITDFSIMAFNWTG